MSLRAYFGKTCITTTAMLLVGFSSACTTTDHNDARSGDAALGLLSFVAAAVGIGAATGKVDPAMLDTMSATMAGVTDSLAATEAARETSDFAASDTELLTSHVSAGSLGRDHSSGSFESREAESQVLPSPGAAAPRAAAPRAAQAQGCRFATYGDLVRWGETTFWREDWTEQYNACGAQNLPGDLEYALGNEWSSNPGHRVFSMSTNSHAPLSDGQQQAKQCAQLRGQIDEYERAMAQLDTSYSTHRDMYEILQEGIIANRDAFNRMC